MTKKQFRVITGEGARDGQFTGEIALLNEDGTDWTPDTEPADVEVSVDDVTGLQGIIDGFEQRIAKLEADTDNDDGGEAA